VSSVRLMSNNPRKFDALIKHGMRVLERVALEVAVRAENERYIRTKQMRFGHYSSEQG
jgi:GTP cyclohydrolase II